MTDNLPKKKPLLWVASVYFAMGLPFVILNGVAALMFRGLGIDDAQITLWTSLIILPWSLKPFWSPLLEMFRTKKFFVVSTQLISGLFFGLVALSLPLPNFFPYAIALMAVIAFSGATHDIAADGVYMSELNKEKQAKYIGWQGAFYNLAKVLAMGALVYLAGVLKEHVGVLHAWMTIMGLCGGILFLLGLYHIWMLPSMTHLDGSLDASLDGPLDASLDDPSMLSSGDAVAPRAESISGAMRETWSIFMAFFQKKYIWIYFAFIVFYRFAEGLVIKIVPLFLNAPVANQGMGLSEQQIGVYYGTLGVAAFVIGSISGGFFISKMGLKKALFSLCCIFNVPFVVYALLAHFQPDSATLICSAVVFEYFSYGFGFVGLTLFIMQQVAPGKYQMAHYAFGSSLANLGVMLPGMASGWLCDMVGYKDFFMWALLAAIPAFIITWIIPFTYPDTKEVTADEIDKELINE